MNKENKPFKFTELVMLYCKNFEVVKTLKQLCEKELNDLANSLKLRLSKYKERWIIVFSKTYGEIQKKDWKKTGLIWYDFHYDQAQIGKGKITTQIRVDDLQLRKKVCKELGKKIKETFGQEAVPSRGSVILKVVKKVEGNNFEDPIIEMIELCIKFSPNFDPYAQ